MSFSVDWLKGKYHAALSEAYYPLETRDTHQMLIDGVLSAFSTPAYQDTLDFFRDKIGCFFERTFSESDFAIADLKELSASIAVSDFLCIAEMVDGQGHQELDCNRRSAYTDMVRVILGFADSFSEKYQTYHNRMDNGAGTPCDEGVFRQRNRMANLLANLGRFPEIRFKDRPDKSVVFPIPMN